jgi:hypothetical protein
VKAAKLSLWYFQKLSGGVQMVICLATALGSLDELLEDELPQPAAIIAMTAPTAIKDALRTDYS